MLKLLKVCGIELARVLYVAYIHCFIFFWPWLSFAGPFVLFMFALPLLIPIGWWCARRLQGAIDDFAHRM